MKTALFIALLLSITLGNVFRYETAWKETYIPDFENVDHVKAWDNWKETFGKTYSGIDEESHRFILWLKNWERINTFNSVKHNFTVGMNQFGDLTDDEFRHYIHGGSDSCLAKRPSYEKAHMKYYDPSSDPNVAPAPASVDWSALGCVTPVKNQGSCGSCWAFSATGAIECDVAIAKGCGNLESLSEQQLVDCSGSYGNYGCSGGLMDYAFKYVEAVGGLATESEYPYTGYDGTCKATANEKNDPISSYIDVQPECDSCLASAVATKCVSVAIEADQFAFQYYTGGVIDGGCGTSLDHGVLVVGYGTSSTGVQYWKVKNSWGTSWGMQGYVLICRNCNQNGNYGECGILMEPSYIVSK